MRAIDRKVLRDVGLLRAQLLAIALVIACGGGLFLCMRSTMRSLEEARANYYAHERFAHAFVRLTRAPEHVSDRLRAIPGVQRVQTRVVADVTLDVPGMVEVATGRLISLPDRGRPVVNDVRLRSGRLPEPGRGGEVIVNEAFAVAHGFSPGARIGAIINGRRETLQIVGTARSPEYTYLVGPGQLFPDERRFAVMWMRRALLGPAFEMDGAFNDAVLQVGRGVRVAGVIQRVDAALERYGGVGAIPQREQQSAFFIENELVQLRTMGMMMPMLFLAVAAFLLHIVVGRIVASQREQIAVMKAVGYRDREVGLHYAKLVGLIVLIGAVASIVIAAWLGSQLVQLYAEFYRFPELPYVMSPGDAVLTVAICAAAALLGTWGAIARTIRIPPAEAMRSEAPPKYTATILERLGVNRLLPPAARMVARELERRPLRALLSVIGIAMAVALMVVSNFSFDSVRHMMRVQFGLNQREDVQLILAKPRSTGVLRELEHLPGVHHAEPFRAVAARIRAGTRVRNISILGIPRDATLHAVLDTTLREIELPPDGIVLSRRLAEILDVGVGQTVRVEVREGERPVRDVPVGRIAETYVGLAAHMDHAALCRMLGETESLSGAWLSVDETELSALHAAVKRTPIVAGIGSRNIAIQGMQKIMDESVGTSVTVSLAFALVMALGVLYNAARITLAERTRDLASLRVLGFRRREVTAILLGEIALLTLIALPPGLWVGYQFAAALAASPGFNTEQFRLPLVIEPRTYGLAVVTVLVAATVSSIAAWRRLDKIDIIEVLKTRD